jgi:outer membrane protein assembly factor BamB
MDVYRAEQEAILVVGFNGRVLGLHPTTGEIVWEHELGGVAVRLAVTPHRIYAASGEVTVALEYPSGTLLWQADVQHADSLLLVGDRLYIGTNGTIECLTTSGQRVFKNGLTGKGYGAVALAVPGHVVQSDTNT